MSDTKPLSEMTDEELINELNAVRLRRATAREARAPSTGKGKQPRVEDMSGRKSKSLDDLFGDDDSIEDKEGLTDE